MRLTVSIPKNFKEQLDKHPDINWAQVMKEGIIEKIRELENGQY